MNKKSKIEENNIEETLTKDKESRNHESIKYNGSVKFTLKNGKKIVYSKTYHNNGNTPLYKFLLECIAGNYTEADRPKYIRLYYNTDENAADTATITASSTVMCGYILLNKISIVSAETIPTRTLHFTIPCSILNLSNYKEINQAALFSSNALTRNNDINNYAACYNFTKTENNTIKWDPVNIESTNGDYNIFIEWTMSFNS